MIVAIRKEQDELVCECDQCGAEIAGGTIADFAKFIEAIKADGWSVHKGGDTYSHFCPECEAGR